MEVIRAYLVDVLRRVLSGLDYADGTIRFRKDSSSSGTVLTDQGAALPAVNKRIEAVASELAYGSRGWLPG